MKAPNLTKYLILFPTSCAFLISSIVYDAKASIIVTLAAFGILTAFLLVEQLRQLAIISASALTAHALFSVFVVWVLLNFERVAPEPMFDFTVFEKRRLAEVCVSSFAGTTLLATFWAALEKRNSGAVIRRFSPLVAFEVCAKRVRRFRPFFGAGSALALVAGIILALTNTNVLQSPYPINYESHWAPTTLFYAVYVMTALLCFFEASCAATRNKSLFIYRIYLLAFLVSGTVLLATLGNRAPFTFTAVLLLTVELALLAAKRGGSWVWAALIAFLIFELVWIWPEVRWGLVGTNVIMVIGNAHLNLWSAYTNPIDNSIRLNDFPMIGASVFHFLYVHELVERGEALNGSTFFNLPMQQLPSFLEGILWTRPLNDNWRLAEFYFHGGGFLSIANAYWNGGVAWMLGFLASLALFCRLAEQPIRKREATTFQYALIIAALPIICVQYFYGIQGLFRVFFIIAIALWLESIVRPPRIKSAIANRPR